MFGICVYMPVYTSVCRCMATRAHAHVEVIDIKCLSWLPFLFWDRVSHDPRAHWLLSAVQIASPEILMTLLPSTEITGWLFIPLLVNQTQTFMLACQERTLHMSMAPLSYWTVPPTATKCGMMVAVLPHCLQSPAAVSVFSKQASGTHLRYTHSGSSPWPSAHAILFCMIGFKCRLCE